MNNFLKIILLFMCVLFGLFMFFVLRNDYTKGNVITFNLPESYTGIFKVRKSPTGLMVNIDDLGGYVYSIPEGGILDVDTIDPFKKVQQFKVIYPSGLMISQYHPGQSTEEIRLFTGSVSSEGIFTFFIGTHQQFDEYLRNRGF